MLKKTMYAKKTNLVATYAANEDTRTKANKTLLVKNFFLSPASKLFKRFKKNHMKKLSAKKISRLRVPSPSEEE